MGSNKVEVRGCCMGIPFGCGTLFVLFLGFAASAAPHVSSLAVSVGLAIAFWVICTKSGCAWLWYRICRGDK